MTEIHANSAAHDHQKPHSSGKRGGPSRKAIISGFTIAGAISLIVGIGYWLNQQRYVYTDQAAITAPLINLTPLQAGPLKRVSVEEGDHLSANQIVARVGDEMVRAEVPGVAISVRQDLGAIIRTGEAVVTMIQPKELQVVARVEEDKGLKDIVKGQRVLFTVDAFGSKEFEGIVSFVSQTDRTGDVVFNISDKRQEKEFDVKIDYDVNAYPELINGMSARVWIVK
ncbi:MAG: HlyD family secretion protein [Candidatus Peribacteraceae bacterium]|nr:HlyD family secretion protein [Candidatus Peribacteraceae bacterium]MDD5742361.1 HlyD family secretion protein [Candidatus Peribacteraceae bacterium]